MTVAHFDHVEFLRDTLHSPCTYGSFMAFEVTNFLQITHTITLPSESASHPSIPTQEVTKLKEIEI